MFAGASHDRVTDALPGTELRFRTASGTATDAEDVGDAEELAVGVGPALSDGLAEAEGEASALGVDSLGSADAAGVGDDDGVALADDVGVGSAVTACAPGAEITGAATRPATKTNAVAERKKRDRMNSAFMTACAFTVRCPRVSWRCAASPPRTACRLRRLGRFMCVSTPAHVQHERESRHMHCRYDKSPACASRESPPSSVSCEVAPRGDLSKRAQHVERQPADARLFGQYPFGQYPFGYYLLG